MVALLAIIILISLSALAVLIIGLFIAKPATRRVLLWVLGLVLLAPVVLFLSMISVRLTHVPQSNAVQPIVVSQSVAGMPSVWQDEIEEQFGAKVYSSPQKAAYGLGKLIGDKHKTLFMGQLEIIKGAEAQTKAGGPKQIILCEDTADVPMFEHLRNGLRQSLSGLEILIQNRTSGGPSQGQVWILLEFQDQSNSFTVQNSNDALAALTIEGNQSGVIKAILQTPDDKFTEQAEYDWRPWIWDMSGFKSQHNRQWLAVYSDTATDLETAQKQVYDKACSMLSHSIQASGYPPTDVLRENLKQFDIETDTYSQELEGMTGPVWRFALLLDADSYKLTKLVQSKTQVVTHQRSEWVQMGLSLLGMMVIIWIAYSVANAATKGYYSVLFAILAIVAAAVVGLLLCTA
jgi:hypothetical protein